MTRSLFAIVQAGSPRTASFQTILFRFRVGLSTSICTTSLVLHSSIDVCKVKKLIHRHRDADSRKFAETHNFGAMKSYVTSNTSPETRRRSVA